MLTKTQQLLIVSMLEKNLTSKNNRLYKSRAFYRTTSYLRRNKIINSRKIDNRSKEFELSMKGTLLARILASFEGIEDDIKDKYGLE